MCSSTQLTCWSQLWPPTTQSSVRTYTPIQDGENAHRITNSRTTQRHFATSSQETRQSNGTPGLQLSRNIRFHFRVVGARDANHVLIRVRHHSRTFVSFPRSVCNAEFLQTILDLVLQLVDLVLILALLCLSHHPISFGMRQLLSSSGIAIQSDLSWTNTFKSHRLTFLSINPDRYHGFFVNCSQCFHVFIISISSIFLITCVFLILCRRLWLSFQPSIVFLIHHSLAINFFPLISRSRTPATRQCTLSVSCLARHLFGLCT